MNKISRRSFLASTGAGFAAIHAAKVESAERNDRPNIILCMADDLGWGDTAYNGHPALKTPNLDDMAASGLRFDRFYAGAPVCSPTRGSCLTGRHPYRYGIFSANIGHLPDEEVNLAEVLKDEGYATGHFGKWHLGTLTKTLKDSNRGGPKGIEHYQPPWDSGFDVCFSTEAKTPTWDPMTVPERAAGGVRADQTPGDKADTYYWSGPDKRATDNLKDDDSRVIMDRAIPFIQKAADDNQPFFAVIWFHTPHLPVVAGPDYLKMYDGYSERERHYYGCITAMDEQIGRLRSELKALGADDNTMLWFSSDNGPEWQRAGERAAGSAGPFRERKRSLYEGGIRVPGILEWPHGVKEARAIASPCSSSDFFPTAFAVLGLSAYDTPEPSDGVNLLPLIDGRTSIRPTPIAFQTQGMYALSDNRYKLISPDAGDAWELYDLLADPRELNDLANDKPEIVSSMRIKFESWRASCASSLEGHDYE